jgi:hypothetical protein
LHELVETGRPSEQLEALYGSMKTISLLPERKVAPKLIIVAAFDRDEEGDLQAVYSPASDQRGSCRPHRQSTRCEAR